MKRANYVSHTTIMVAILAIPGLTLAETPVGSGNSPSNSKPDPSYSLQDRATDMVEGQGNIANKYDVVPVRRGELVDEKGGPLDHVVKNKKGETLGTIEKLLKDAKTGKTEYAVLELEKTKDLLPLQWNQFKQEGGKLTLNASRKDLYPLANSTYSKDLSPELSQYMDAINELRKQPKPKSEGPGAPGLPFESVGGFGSSGPPPGPAPGYEGGKPSSKR